MTTVTLNVSIEQAEVIQKATDVFSRLSIGQIGMIAEMVSQGEIPLYASLDQPKRLPTADQCDAVREKVGEILAILGYNGIGHSLGVGNGHVPIAGHRAYEVYKVLSKALAEHRNPSPSFRGVSYDGLVLRYTQDPKPEVSIG